MKFAKVVATVLAILSASNAFAQPYDIKALAKKGMKLKEDPKNNIYKAASEVQAGTVIDFAVSLPPYSVIQGVQIYAKNGVGMTVNSAEWQLCDLQTITHRCHSANAGYADGGFFSSPTDYGVTFQARIVPDANALVRGRLVVFYSNIGSKEKH